MKYIELCTWDVGIRYTASIWVGDVSLPDPNDSQFYLSNDVEKAEQYLRELGYTQVETSDFEVGGGL